MGSTGIFLLIMLGFGWVLSVAHLYAGYFVWTQTEIERHHLMTRKGRVIFFAIYTLLLAVAIGIVIYKSNP